MAAETSLAASVATCHSRAAVRFPAASISFSASAAVTFNGARFDDDEDEDEEEEEEKEEDEDALDAVESNDDDDDDDATPDPKEGKEAAEDLLTAKLVRCMRSWPAFSAVGGA